MVKLLRQKEEIRAVVGNMDKTGTFYKNIIGIVDEKMKNRLDCLVHMAAYCLDPYYRFNDPSIFDSEVVMDGFVATFETIYHGDYEKQNQVLNDDLHKFKDQIRNFGKAVAKSSYKDFDSRLGI